MSDERADRIKAKIDASQERSRGRGSPRKGRAPATPRRPGQQNLFNRAVDDHPFALLAGGIVLGAVAAALLPASFGRKLAGRALALATVAGEIGALYGNKAWGAAADGARVGQEKLEDLGESLAEQSSDARRKAIELGVIAGKRALELAGAAARNAREGSSSALSKISDLTGDLSDRVRH